MKFAHSEIPNIINHFDEIKSDVIVVGGGRWASIITKELLKNFPNIKNIRDSVREMLEEYKNNI